MSKKIENHIDSSLWAKSRYGVVASAWWDLGGWEDGGEYVLNFHQEGMPVYKSERHKTLEQLEVAMREHEPDLRKWRYMGD